MAESALAFLQNQLSNFITSEAKLLGGLKKDIQYVKDELGSMTAFLRVYEAREDNDLELQEWVNQVRKVAYDIEDVLDEFILHFAHRRPDGFCDRVRNTCSSLRHLRARHHIATEIKNIKNRVVQISDRRQRYATDSLAPERDSRRTAPEISPYDIRAHALLFEEGNYLVGIEEPKNQLLSFILNDNPELKVVSVVGTGGLGKTTLVKRVYEDRNLRRRFDIHAWVTVSQRVSIKDLFKNLVQQFCNEIREQFPAQVESMDDDSIRAFVKEFLKEKRYIIVLDDVWSIDSWDAIKYALPDAKRGSRLILTTRAAEVASISCQELHGLLHKMEPLSPEDSWTLFCNKTFEDNHCPSYLENVSRSILAKCEGLPLTIVGIARLLALKDKSKIADWNMVHRSLGGELEGKGKLDRVKRILILGYNDLPYYLKSCLLLASIFPEDYPIHSWELCGLWMAEGFVQERKGLTFVEVAEGYLRELVDRNLIQLFTLKSNETQESFRVHDLLREIVLSKSTEVNFATTATTKYTRLQDNVRRLAIHDFNGNPLKGVQSKHLRSLVIFGYSNPLSSSTISKFLLGGPKLLKVLYLREAQFKEIPKEVFNLFHLKFLNLRGSQVEVIPKSIGKLQNLEYLDLAETKVEELPSDILKLEKLTQLWACQLGNPSNNHAPCGFKAPKEFGKLVFLHRVFYIDASDSNIVAEIGKLTELRELGITKVQQHDGKQLCSSIGKLVNLRILSVNSIEEDEILDLQHPISPTPQFLEEIKLNGRLERVPIWLPSLQSLRSLSLWRSRLLEDPLQVLQDLPNLVNLILHYTYEGETLCFDTGGFQMLKFLELGNLKKLKWIKIEESAMPHLAKLSLNNCGFVEELPQGIQNLTKLQFFELSDMSNELITKLQNLDMTIEDYRRIAHIPEVVFANWINGKWERRYLGH